MSTSRDYGFTFNGHHSTDFGLRVLDSRVIGEPAKNKVTVQVPYANGLLDLSGVYGTNSFSERELTFPCEFRFGSDEPQRTSIQITQLMRWLTSPVGKIKLVDDAQPDYYYMAEVEQAPAFQEDTVLTDFTVVFTCYPYRFHERSSDLWDPFCFDLDVAQKTAIDLDGIDYVKLINNGETTVTLRIDCDSSFSLVINDETFSVPSGQSASDEIVLDPGENSLSLFGKAHVSFDWFEEVI